MKRDVVCGLTVVSIIDRNTKIALNDRPSDSRHVEAIINPSSLTITELVANIQRKFGGYTEIIEGCIELILLSFSDHKVLKRPRGLLLSGPPGTGKSKLMNLLADSFSFKSFKIDPSILLHRYLLQIPDSVVMILRLLPFRLQGGAESELAQLFHTARESAPSILLIDDIELIFGDRATANDDQKRLVSSLLTLLDGISSDSNDNQSHVFLIATSSRPQLIDPALRRPGRLDKEFELVVPSSHDRYQILHNIVEDMVDHDTHQSDSFVSLNGIKEVSGLSHGMVASDLQILVKEAYLLAFQEQFDSQNDISILTDRFCDIDVSGDVKDDSSSALTASAVRLSDRHLLKALSKVSPSALREVVIEVPNVKWEDIGGMDDVKQSIREVVEWPLQYPELFSAMGISPPRGVLL